jgi:hypothetical protein
MRSIARLASLLLTILTACALAFASSALAVSSPVDIGTTTSSTPPAVAVDPSGTAYIVWAATSGTEVNFCKLPAGASACSFSTTLPVSGTSPGIGNPQVLFDGSTMFVLVDVTEGGSEKGTGVQEWSATSPYTSFVHAAGGAAVDWVGDNAGEVGAAVLPGTAHGLGFAWEIAGLTPGSGPQFEETPFAAVEQSEHSSPKWATLDPTDLLKASNGGGFLASQLGSNPGVLDVVNTIEAPGCGTFGTAFAYAPGVPASPADYDKSPGASESAWHALAELDCHVSSPAVAGGPKGFGVLESDEATSPESTIYRPFDETNGTFDLPAVTVASEGEQFSSLGQDEAGNLYATWRGGAGVRLAFSSDGGASWTGPATIDTDAAVNDLTSAVGPSGQGFAAWVDAAGPDTGPLYAQPFVQKDAVPSSNPPSTSSNSSSSSSGSTSTTPPAAPPPPFGTPPPPPPATITQATTVDGDVVSVSTPNKCVRNGFVSSELKVSLPSAKRKGKVVVKIYEAIFKVGNTTVIVKRKHLSDAPFKVTIHLKHVKPGTKLVLTVHALIAVHHGPKRSKTFKLTLTSCA